MYKRAIEIDYTTCLAIRDENAGKRRRLGKMFSRKIKTLNVVEDNGEYVFSKNIHDTYYNSRP